jgi:viroplasmin and RNaseH domain-containing protein
MKNFEYFDVQDIEEDISKPIKYYAVKNGRKRGIFDNWAECQQQIFKFSGASFKSFPSLNEAQDYLEEIQNTSKPIKYYAVKNGRKRGIFDNWDECQQQISSFKGAIFKSFLTLNEAQNYLEEEKISKESLNSINDESIDERNERRYPIKKKKIEIIEDDSDDEIEILNPIKDDIEILRVYNLKNSK